MIEWYPWVVVAHVVGAFGFVLAHGVSAIGAFRMRSDPRPENVAAILNLAGTSFALMYLSLLLLLVAGVVAGFMGDFWGRLWIWVAIGVLVLIVGVMYGYGTPYYIRVRHALGMTAPQDKKGTPAPEPLPPDELAALLRSARPEILALVGGGGLVVIIWLMLMKPF